MFKSISLPLLATALLLWLAPAADAQRPGFYSGSFPGGSAGRAPAPSRGDRGPTRDYSSGPRHHGPGPGYYRPPFYTYPYAYPYYAYDSLWNYGYGGIYYDPATNSTAYFLPPTYVPGELNYGPLAMERFLGIHRNPQFVPPVPPVGPDPSDNGLTAAEIAGKLRKSSPVARERARRLIRFGDARFAKQEFHTARQYYKSAIETAPDLVDAYVREGFALLTVNQYRTATRALKIALELDAQYVKSEFRLEDIYRNNHLAKESHLETVANKALASPDDADLLFLVGMMLYADGEYERAYRFLGRAAQLGGPEAARLLAPLLEAAAPAEVVPPAPDRPGPAGTDT